MLQKTADSAVFLIVKRHKIITEKVLSVRIWQEQTNKGCIKWRNLIL